MSKKLESHFILYKFSEWSRDITSLASPLLLIFVPFIILGSSSTIFHTLLVALLVNEVIGSLIKIIFPKKRPNKQTYKNILEKIDAGSFPSIHASRITLTYLTLFSNTEITNHKIVYIFIIIMVIISRVLLKKHFIIDVIGGFVIGFIIWLITFA